MKDGLTKEEQNNLKAVQRFLTWRKSSTKSDAVALKQGHAKDYIIGGYSDADKKRIAIGIGDYLDLFANRPANPNAYGAHIIECAQDARLPAVEVLKILVEHPKKRKSVCSIAEFNELFVERRGVLSNALEEAERNLRAFRTEEEETRTCLNESLGKYRDFFPDYPNVDDILMAWKTLFTQTFFEDWGDLENTQKTLKVVRRELQRDRAWPAVPLYCIFLAAQVPKEKLKSATEYVLKLSGDRRASCDDPTSWRKAIAAIPNLSAEEDHQYAWETLWYEFSATTDNQELRDTTNALWQVKLEAASPQFTRS